MSNSGEFVPAPIDAHFQQPLELNVDPLEPNAIAILPAVQLQTIANQIANSKKYLPSLMNRRVQKHSAQKGLTH